MWILLIPLIFAEILFWTFLAYFAWRVFNCFRTSNWMGLAFWLMLFSAPFIYYQYKHLEADRQEIIRAEQLATLARSELPETLPSFIEVYGHLTEHELLILLGGLGFSEVAVLQRPHRGEVYGFFAKLTPGCDALGQQYLERWKKLGRFKAPTKADKECIQIEWKTVSEDRSGIDAIEYRTGTESTLQKPGNSWYNGAYEVRLRTSARYDLLSYWERPYISRPNWPGPWGYAYPGNTDPKKYRAPKRLDFLLESIGEQSSRRGS